MQSNGSSLDFNSTEAGFAPLAVQPFLKGNFGGAFAAPVPPADPIFSLLGGTGGGTPQPLGALIGSLSSGQLGVVGAL